MRSHDFPGQRLRAHRAFAERLNLLALLVDLLNHVPVVRPRLCEQPLEVESLFGTLVSELLVRGLALVEPCGEAIPFGRRFLNLRLKPLDLTLMRSPVIAELRLQPISFGCYLLQPVTQVLKMCASLS